MATTRTTTQAQDDDLIEAAIAAVQQPQAAQQAAQAPGRQPQNNSNTSTPTAPSHTLETLEPRRRPQPATICEGCPNSVWFTSPSELKCYCRVMYLITWASREPNQLTACDGIFIGQEDALHM